MNTVTMSIEELNQYNKQWLALGKEFFTMAKSAIELVGIGPWFAPLFGMISRYKQKIADLFVWLTASEKLRTAEDLVLF